MISAPESLDGAIYIVGSYVPENEDKSIFAIVDAYVPLYILEKYASPTDVARTAPAPHPEAEPPPAIPLICEVLPSGIPIVRTSFFFTMYQFLDL